MRNKIIFWIILIVSLSLVPITILSRTNPLIALRYPSLALNLVQRFLGLTVFVLMFWQIILGAYMEKWVQKVGGWIFNFHVWEGILVYSLAFLHPLVFFLFQYFNGKGIDPVSVFLGVCLLCDPTFEYFYTFGRVAFWLLTVGVFAGLYRSVTPFMKKNWKKFHVINYLVFLLVGIHGFKLGPDFARGPFLYFAIIAYLLVIFTIIKKIPGLIASYKKWISEA